MAQNDEPLVSHVNFPPTVLILISVTCSAAAQILLKKGMSSASSLSAIDDFNGLLHLFRILTEPWVMGGLSLYGLGAVVWLFALARVDVSFAYPFVGLGFLLVMVFGFVVFNDSLGPMRILGTLLVVSGVFLISRT